MIRLLINITIAFTFFQYPVYAQNNFDVKLIPDSIKSRANSVIRHSHVTLDIYDNKLIYTYDYAITALNKKHENKLLFAAHYKEDESKVEDVKISIYDTDGQLINKIKNKEIKDYGLQDIEFADDMRSMIYLHSSPVFPVTIHVTYTHEYESKFSIPNWYPIPDFKQALEFASIRIEDHNSDSFNYQAHQLPDPIDQSETLLHYELKQQKPYFKEEYMPDKNMCFPRLELALKRFKYFGHEGKINDWDEFGAWVYEEMFVPKQNVESAQLKKETAHFIGDQDSDLEIAQKLYNYIQETTRYVLISLEDGGWSPLSVATVHNRKYGDCKALSLYFNTLCKAYNLEASLALVHAGEEKRGAKEDFFSSSQFNHVISKLDIEGQVYWVDCTSKVNPFNFLGDFTDDRNVLLIKQGEGIITKTPAYKYSKKTETSITFSEDGKLDATIKIETEGIGIGPKLYSLSELSDQEMTTYQKELLEKYAAPKINNYTYEFDTTQLKFTENFNIACLKAGEKLGTHFKIEINRNELDLPVFKRDKNRVWSIEILRNKEFEAITRYKHDLTLLPIVEDDVTIDSPFGKYTFSTSASSGEILITRRLKINKGSYSKDKYNEIKSFFDKIKKIEKRSIILSSKS